LGREEAHEMLTYFWEEKGDLERWTDHERGFALFPEVRKAWQDYRMAKQILTAVLRGVR